VVLEQREEELVFDADWRARGGCNTEQQPLEGARLPILDSSEGEESVCLDGTLLPGQGGVVRNATHERAAQRTYPGREHLGDGPAGFSSQLFGAKGLGRNKAALP